MRRGAYRIVDEPKPGALSHLVVQPFWPLLGLMLGGAWLAWPWFIFNSIAVGSATRAREIAMVIAGLLVSAGILYGIVTLGEAGILDRTGARFGLLLLVVWKLCVGYLLQMWQTRSVQIFEHFRGTTRNAFVVIVAAAVLGSRYIEPAITNPFLRRILE